MIKITSVEIDGFIVPSQKVKLDFVESNVVCIYGNNGSGKTTFLEILFAVFDRDEEILEKHNVDKVTITVLNEDNPIVVERIKNTDKWKSILEQESEYDIDIEKIKSKYYWSDVENSLLGDVSSLLLGTGRGIDKNELKINTTTLLNFFRNNKKISENKILTGNEIDELGKKLFEYLMPKEKNNTTENDIIEKDKVKALDNKKNIYLKNIEINTVEAFLNNKYKEAVLDAKARIKESLFKTSFNFFKSSSTPKRVNLEKLQERLMYNKLLLLEMLSHDEDIEIETIFDSLEKDEDFLEKIGITQQIILFNIVKELQSEVELFNEIQLFINEYNSFLNYGKKLVFNSNGISIAPQNHLLEKLSSGERHLLTFLATILLMGEEQDFILIDEPEISLNVMWQKKILNTISKLAPNSQIIVATHSPLITRGQKVLVGLVPKAL